MTLAALAAVASAALAGTPGIAPVQMKVVGPTATVSGGKARLRMTCTGGEALASCPGRVVLRAGSVVVGGAHVSVVNGGSAQSVSVPLSRAVRKELKVKASVRPDSGDPAASHSLVLISSTVCRFKHAHAVETGSSGRIFYLDDPDSPGDRNYGGCLYARGRSLFLEHDGFDVEGVSDVVELPTLAGPYFAAAVGTVGDNGAHKFGVELLDLRRERPSALFGPFRKHAGRVFRASATSGVHDDVTALVLSSSGHVAWIGVDRDRSLYEVHAGDRMLDSGPDIDPKSLRLSGGTLSWTRAGAPRTAPIG